MEIEIKNNDIILHGVKCLDLELTLDCGQAFRWVSSLGLVTVIFTL